MKISTLLIELNHETGEVKLKGPDSGAVALCLALMAVDIIKEKVLNQTIAEGSKHQIEVVKPSQIPAGVNLGIVKG